MLANMAVDLGGATSAKEALLALHKFVIPAAAHDEGTIDETYVANDEGWGLLLQR